VIPADTVRRLMEELGVPGVALGVVRHADEHVEGFGVTSAANPLPVDGDTLFQVGSITKTFTATAAMVLVEQGRLDLDAPVRSYVPELRLADEDVAARVTMRHLLTHSGGWVGDYFDLVGPGDDALAQMVTRLDRLEQLTPLGETWSYNNAGFYVAGRVVEVLAGKPYEHALHELVLEPLGLEQAFFFAEDVMTYRFAVGHDRSGAVARPWGIGRPAAAAGGLVLSASGLLRYAKLQFGGSDLLSPESLAAMRVPHADVGRTSGADAIGLAWFLTERDGRAFQSHGGATNGQQALLVVAPEERFAFAALTNHDNGSALAAEVLDETLASVLGIEPEEPEHLGRSPEELAAYVGAFEAPLTRLELSLEGDSLLLTLVPRGGFPQPDSPPHPAPPPTRLAFDRPDAVVALDPPAKGARGDFIRGEDGEVLWFRFGGRLHRPL
jgi:CubicO group peptidase (beta-lactamase class C family)